MSVGLALSYVYEVGHVIRHKTPAPSIDFLVELEPVWERQTDR